MKLLYAGMLFVSLSMSCGKIFPFHITVAAPERQKTHLCVLVPSRQPALEVASIIQKDLMWSNQFIVDQKIVDRVTSKRVLKKMAAEYPFIIILSLKSKAIEWRLYDATHATMLTGKQVGGANATAWRAHHCADGIWHALTGTPGCFSSRIAFCKEKRFGKGRRPHKYIYIADFDGTHVRPLVTTPTVNLAPRWNRATAQEPLLYYSECTLRNVRLVAVDMDGHRRTMSDFDGLNMLISWSPDGSKAILCLSRGTATHLYLYKKNEPAGQRLEQITRKGTNISPCFIDDDRIVFCSDNNTHNKPHICCMDLTTREITDLISGYCSSPYYSPVTRKIAYAKLVQGELQLFTYQIDTKVEHQVTFDQGSKDECCWSPCGNYLVYAVQNGNNSRIAILNVAMGFQRFITPESDRCSYPSWSPLYEQVLLIN